MNERSENSLLSNLISGLDKPPETCWGKFFSIGQNDNFFKGQKKINPFLSNVTFLYPQKISFQGVCKFKDETD